MAAETFDRYMKMFERSVQRGESAKFMKCIELFIYAAEAQKAFDNER